MNGAGADDGAGRVLRIGVVTLGGERRAIMEEQFSQLSQQCAGEMRLDVTYLDGVKGVALTEKRILADAAALLLDVCLGRVETVACCPAYIHALPHA